MILVTIFSFSQFKYAADQRNSAPIPGSAYLISTTKMNRISPVIFKVLGGCAAENAVLQK
jgi:hypothetical protein